MSFHLQDICEKTDSLLEEVETQRGRGINCIRDLERIEGEGEEVEGWGSRHGYPKE